MENHVFVSNDRQGGKMLASRLPLFSSGRVKLLDDKRLVHPLAGLERTVLPAGRDRIYHGHGGHVLANSAAVDLVRAAEDRPILRVPRAAVMRAARSGRQVPISFHGPLGFLGMWDACSTGHVMQDWSQLWGWLVSPFV
jgi:hypothetical protein